MRLAVNTALYALAASLTLLDATSAGAALPAKACDLMTQQTATAIYGHPVASGRYEMATVGISDCRFDGPERHGNVSSGHVQVIYACGPRPNC